MAAQCVLSSCEARGAPPQVVGVGRATSLRGITRCERGPPPVAGTKVQPAPLSLDGALAARAPRSPRDTGLCRHLSVRCSHRTPQLAVSTYRLKLVTLPPRKTQT